MNYKKMARRADVLFGYAHWKWGGPHGMIRPSRPSLEKAIQSLVTEVNEGAEQVESGRLLAIRQEHEPGDTTIKVCIVIGQEHWGQH